MSFARNTPQRFAKLESYLYRPASRDLLILLALVTLTALMMWPWVLHLRDAVSDRGDAYALVYWLWWDYHQTFHNPINLFHATAFYPYRYTMAFTENEYGVALLCFPLFALGLRPMTVHSIATFLAFPFAGYGMFRLTRTLTGRRYAAWVAAIVFAFVPYHFQRLPHLHLLFTAWLPLTLEALVMFARQPTRRRAMWLVVAFVMNALTAVTWFILSLIPLLLTFVLLVISYRLARNRPFWTRLLGAAVGVAILLLPFLFPFYRVHRLYGFVRSVEDVNRLSADPIHWLSVSGRNKLWKGMGGEAARDEFTLFPGFIPPLLALMAIFVISPIRKNERFEKLRTVSEEIWKRSQVYLPAILDTIALSLLVVAALIIGWGEIHLNLFGRQLFQSADPTWPLIICVVILIIRSINAPPEIFLRLGNLKRFGSMVKSSPYSLALAIAAIWALTGFLGSFGMHFAFHRTLYNYVPLFTSMRAPVRWAMVCYVGLALAAGIGAERLREAIRRRRRFKLEALVCVVVVGLILFEQRVAPIEFVRGEVEPDAISLRLRTMPMKGGIVEFPAEKNNYAYYRYMLRGADHGRPFVTASASFTPPIVERIETWTSARPIPDELLDLFESIPVSYLIVHKSVLNIGNEDVIDAFVTRSVASGRLRFINRFGEPEGPDELYAVTRIEPNATPEAPYYVSPTNRFVRQQYLDLLGREPSTAEIKQWQQRVTSCGLDAQCVLRDRIEQDLILIQSEEFQNSTGFLFNLYRASFGKPPKYVEWQRIAKEFAAAHSAKEFVEKWVDSPEFAAEYPASMSKSEFVDRLSQRSAIVRPTAGKATMNRSIESQHTRADLLFDLVNKSQPAFQDPEALTSLFYLLLLKRDADPDGLRHWVEILKQDPRNTADVFNGFVDSQEYRSRF